MKAIADTGFVVAFANRNDRHHRWALDVARTLTEPALTCEAVLAESAFHLQSVSYVVSLIKDQLLRVEFDLPSHLQAIQELAHRYVDRHPDLADLCLIRMSEMYPKYPVITVDEKDFRVYRRNRREIIPLVCPGALRT